jgi:hypothetical protein
MALDPAGNNNLGPSDMAYRTSVSAGTTGGAAGTNKLWLPIWSGEVIHAYDHYNMFEGLVTQKTIASGTTAEFPVTGTINLKAAWNAGEELSGGTATSKTFAIKLDKRPMAAHFEIDNVDQLLTQWEFRAELARQAGLTLANTRDKQIAAYIARAGMEDLLANDPRTGLTVPNQDLFTDAAFDNFGLSTATATDRTTAALKVLEAIENFMVHLQEINAPTEGVYCVVTPRAFQDIRALGVARSYNELYGVMANGTGNGPARPMFGGVAEAGGLGAPLAMGMHNVSDALEYQGCMIIKSNHLPVVDYDVSSSANIGEARYNIDGVATKIKALIFQKDCVASLSLQGLKVDTVDDVRRNTTFTVASMFKGTGVLRPELAVVISGLANASGDERSELRTLAGMTAEYVVTA